jgi:hypothetical protein
VEDQLQETDNKLGIRENRSEAISAPTRDNEKRNVPKWHLHVPPENNVRVARKRVDVNEKASSLSSFFFLIQWL